MAGDLAVHAVLKATEIRTGDIVLHMRIVQDPTHLDIEITSDTAVVVFHKIEIEEATRVVRQWVSAGLVRVAVVSQCLAEAGLKP